MNAEGSAFRTYIQHSNPDGTYENNLELRHNRPYPLNPGDIILVGRTRILYEVVPVQPAQAGFPTQASNPSGGSGGFIGFLILVGAGIYYASQNQNNSTSTLQKTLADFCSAVKSRDYQSAYNQFSTHAKSLGAEAQFASTLQQIFSQQDSLRDCTVSGVKPNQTTATGTLTYIFANGKTLSYLDSLITENSVWKVDSSKTVISKEESLCYGRTS